VLDRRRVLKLAGGATFASTLSAAPILRGSFAQSGQTWPNRSVRLIVPFPQGGRPDAIVRVVGVKLSDIWRQQLVVENRGGGTTNIGTEAVARAEPDGYTLLLQSTPLAVNRFLFRSLPYDALTDLEPVSLLCEYPLIMTVPISSPANSVAEFIAHANANRGRITFASSGHGTPVHLAGEMFQRMARIEMLHVPYRGTGPALIDLIPGRVDVMFSSIGATLPLIRGGKLRGLAVTTAKRTAAAPQVPTIAEGGVPGFDVSSWYAFFAPAQTPAAIIRQLQSDVVTALADPAIKARLEAQGITMIGSTPAELGTFLKAEVDKWGPVIREAGIRGDD
jgi:tripartite-type tricarboxylate transporter receptor subunit TctC